MYIYIRVYGLTSIYKYVYTNIRIFIQIHIRIRDKTSFVCVKYLRIGYGFVLFCFTEVKLYRCVNFAISYIVSLEQK